MVECLVRWSKENALSLHFSKDKFEEYTQKLQWYLDGKICKYELPFEFENLKNDEIYLSCFQFINLFFGLLQIRFADTPNFEQTLRRYMDNWISPISTKKMQAPDIFSDFKSVFISYESFMKKNRDNFVEGSTKTCWR